ncbi:MAG TPA: hypothetical protein VNE21_08890 [Mycobacteriales bacterium]|nr:hypothetical protein [Mycobacteriales bacterium]
MKAKETAKIIRAIAESFETYPTQLSIRVNVLDSRIVSSGPEPDISARPEVEVEEMKTAIDHRIANTVTALRELADAARSKDAKTCEKLYARLDDLAFVPPIVLAVIAVCLGAAKLLAVPGKSNDRRRDLRDVGVKDPDP